MWCQAEGGAPHSARFQGCLAQDPDTQFCFHRKDKHLHLLVLSAWGYQHNQLIKTSKTRSCSHNCWCQCLNPKAHLAQGWERLSPLPPSQTVLLFPSQGLGELGWSCVGLSLVKTLMKPLWSVLSGTTWRGRNAHRCLLWIFLLHV